MKVILLTVAYILVLFLMASLTNYFLWWSIEHVVFTFINWYNNLHLLWKVAVLFMAGGVFLSLLGFITSFINAINTFIFYWLPSNTVTLIISIIVFISNTAYGIKLLWDSFPSFSFLKSIEFAVLCIMIIAINSTFINRHKLKDRI